MHWEPIAGSREWEECFELLAQHPAAGLSGEGQMTDDLLEDLSRRAQTLTGARPVRVQTDHRRWRASSCRCRRCSTSI